MSKSAVTSNYKNYPMNSHDALSW